MKSASGILRGALAAGLVVVTGLEILSVIGWIRQLPLLGLSAASAWAFFRVGRSGNHPVQVVASPDPRFGGDRVRLGCLVAIGAVTLLVAVGSAPNTWDSMSYHLARVAEWFDHGSVQHYPTGIDRQLWEPPFAEYFVLLAYGGMGGRDFLAGLPQWLGGVGAVVATLEIARLLNASSRSRWIVALFTATAPIVILEATSTQTDLLGGFWIAVAASLALSEFLTPSFGSYNAGWFAAALALAIGTKGTALPLGLPWLLVFLAPALKPARARVALRQIAIVGLTILLINGPHFARNLTTFDHPLGPVTAQRMLRPTSLGAPTIFSNLIAHASLQTGTPWAGVNRHISETIISLHSGVGLDLPSLYPYFGGFRIIGWTTQEDIAGNPLHFWLGLAALFLLATTWRRVQRPQRVAAAAYLAGILLFALTVRWQPFGARLHTPMLVLLSPCLLLVLVGRWPRLAALGLAAALLASLPPLFLNASRPLLPPEPFGWSWIRTRSILVEPREAQYFANDPSRYPAYFSAIGMVRRLGCTRVAIQAAYDSWEYPLWALGRPDHITFEHYSPEATDPERPSAAAGRDCAVVGLDQPAGWRPSHLPSGVPPLVAQGRVTVWR